MLSPILPSAISPALGDRQVEGEIIERACATTHASVDQVLEIQRWFVRSGRAHVVSRSGHLRSAWHSEMRSAVDLASSACSKADSGPVTFGGDTLSGLRDVISKSSLALSCDAQPSCRAIKSAA